jgi:FHIPEP family
MAETTTEVIPIRIELGGAAHPLLADPRLRSAMDGLAGEVDVLLDDLGLDGRPLVDATAGEGRILRVLVHGRLQPIPAWLPGRVLAAMAPAGAEEPPGWTEALTDRERDPETTARLVQRLALEAIRLRPACLVGSAQAAAFAARMAANEPDLPPLVTEVWLSVLRTLLDLGVSVADQPVIADVLAGLSPSQAVENVIEAVFARLAAREVELHVHPGFLATLVPGQEHEERVPLLDEDEQHTAQHEPFKAALDELFEELGLMPPDPVWVASKEVQLGAVAVRINHRLGCPIPGPQPGEVAAGAPAWQLRLQGVAARPALDPAGDRSMAIVDQAHENRLADLGLTTWTPTQFAARCLKAEARRFADRLLSVPDAEYLLGRFQLAFPTLAAVALNRYPIEQITCVLRGLLAEQLSVGNLRAVLERLVAFETVPVQSGEQVVLDDRLPIPESEAPSAAADWRNLLQFVRNGLPDYLDYRYGLDTGPLTVWETGPQLTARFEALAAGGATGLDDREREALVNPLSPHDAETVQEGGRQVVLTSTRIRWMVRNALGAELPDLPVLAHAELRPDRELPPTVLLEPGG